MAHKPEDTRINEYSSSFDSFPWLASTRECEERYQYHCYSNNRQNISQDTQSLEEPPVVLRREPSENAKIEDRETETDAKTCKYLEEAMIGDRAHDPVENKSKPDRNQDYVFPHCLYLFGRRFALRTKSDASL